MVARRRLPFAGALLLTAVAACSTLQRVLNVEAPRIEVAEERESVLALDAASLITGQPVATIRIWARVNNPNTFGLTLSRLRGDLFLEGREMAELDLPLGLPLPAVRDTVIPIDLRLGLPSLSTLGTLGEALLRRSAVRYRFDGTVGVDAGSFGQPTFGPRTWLQGSLSVRTGER